MDAETYATWFRGHPIPGDILFVCKGSPGNVALVPSPIDFCIAQDMVAVRPDPSRVYPRYLFAALRSPEVQAQIRSMHVGTMIPHFKKGDFDKLMIPLRGLGEQRVIGDIYVELSMKIELSRLARALADQMVRLAVDAAVADGTNEERSLGDLVDRVNEVVRPEDAGDVIAYVGLEHLPRGRLFLDAWGSLGSVTSAKARFLRGDILFGKLRPYFKKVAVAPVAGVCSTDILVLRPRDRRHLGFLLTVSASDPVIQYATAAVTGTRMPRVSWDYLAAWKTSVPSESRLADLDALTAPIIEQALALVEQEHSLTALRDTLLPELMSGRIHISAAGFDGEASV